VGAKRYRTGELARQASVTVRTVRYYDRAGLLSPSERTEAGHRLYDEADLVRLQQIVALKFLGFSLAEIRVCLGDGPTRLQDALAQQRSMLRDRRGQLDRVIAAVERAERALAAGWRASDAIAEVMEVMRMEQQGDWRKKYFTDEQLQEMERLSKGVYSEEAQAKLAARGAHWTEEDQARATQAWADVDADLKRMVAAGTDPASAEAQAWAQRRSELLQAFTGGDPDIEAGLQKWWETFNAMPEAQRPFAATSFTPEEAQFMEQAMEAYRSRAG
jgi:DNA-binding transcriptional MerR regulator